jgi:predicted DNA-binding transcriptional regulator AlpA
MEEKMKTSNIVAEQPMVLSAMRLSQRLGVSLRHIRRMDSAGKLPRPVRLGKVVLWKVDEINAWLNAGAPDRKTWEQMKKEVM